MKKLRRIAVVAGLVLIYAGIYFGLSRTSQKELATFGMDVFYYYPCSPREMAESKEAQKIHQIGIIVFYPIWFMDRKVFQGPYYGGIPLMGFDSSEGSTDSR